MPSPTVEELKRNKQLAAEVRRQSEQMADIEFQMEIAPNLGYEGEIDPSIARHHPLDMTEYSLGGFYVPEDASEREVRRPYTSTVDGKRVKIPKERGTVNTVGSQADAKTWSHEYRHKQKPGISERTNRLYDGYMAQDKDDWDSAVDLWGDQRNRRRKRGDKMGFGEAEKDLIDNLSDTSGFGGRKRREERAADPELAERRAESLRGVRTGGRTWLSDALTNSFSYPGEIARQQYWARRMRQLEEEEAQ